MTTTAKENNLVEQARVEIMGRRYTLRGDVDSDYMVSLSRYVDGKIKELRSVSPNLDSTRLAILVALNLADELFIERNTPKQLEDPLKMAQLRENEENLKQISEKTNFLIQMLENGLIGNPVH